MKVVFTHIGGWNGGERRYNGLSRSDFMRNHGFDPTLRPGMSCTISNGDEELPARVGPDTHKVSGTDYDHGHEYTWSYEDPTFIFEGAMTIPLPASVIWKDNCSITVEMP